MYIRLNVYIGKHKKPQRKGEKRMALFNNNNNNRKPEGRKGILGAFSVDLIKWEPEVDREASVICHKFEAEDFPNGSLLVVHPSQIAVFINNLSAGSSLDNDGTDGRSQVAIFIGPCEIKLETGDSRFAPFRKISHALTGGESAYHSSVYFINTTYMNELSWGTQSPIYVVDPEEGVNVHVRAFGLFGAHIEQTDTSVAAVQASKFLRKVVGTRADYTRDELIAFMRARILEYVPDLLAKNIVDKKISVLKIQTHLSEFSVLLKDMLSSHFDDFGLTLDNFSFTNINAPDEDLAAINEMKIKKQRKLLEAQGNAGAMDIESEALARKREREGYTYQDEKTFDVFKSAAQNEGTASGLMGAGMGLGMGFGLGGAFQNGMSEIGKKITPAPAPAQPSGSQPVCKKCGTALQSGARFCLNCGNKVEEGKACPHCGTVLPEGAKFCFNCGKPLTRVCANCGAELPENAKFCLICGNPV